MFGALPHSEQNQNISFDNSPNPVDYRWPGLAASLTPVNAVSVFVGRKRPRDRRFFCKTIDRIEPMAKDVALLSELHKLIGQRMDAGHIAQPSQIVEEIFKNKPLTGPHADFYKAFARRNW
ncbi:hypothetical protein ACOJBO_03485 [Rhizobium beringeri]